MLKPVEWIPGEYERAKRNTIDGRNNSWSQRRNRKKIDLILAAGEATGHHHRVLESGARIISRPRGLDGNSVQVLLVPKNGATVTHEEHDSIALPKGAYEIIRQKEYVDPSSVGLSSRLSQDFTYVRD